MQTDISRISALPFFFIIGRPRSGTTLLRTLLDAHPNVAIPQESPVILNLSGKYGRINQWDEKKIHQFYHDLFSQRIFGVWNIDKHKLKASLVNCSGNHTYHDLIKVLYANFVSIYPKEEIKIIGDKNPVYSYNFTILYRIFPDAKFIHLTRDYRDQILSMRKMDFEMHHPALVALRWRMSVKTLNRIKKKFPDKFFPVRYEDLVADPEQQLKTICRFLSIEFKPEMLEFYKKEATVDFLPEHAMKKYHAALFNPVTAGKVSKWTIELSERNIKMADMIVGKYAETAGYNKKYSGFYPWIFLLILPYVVYGQLWNFWRELVNRFPLKLKMAVKKTSPLFPALYHKFAIFKRTENRNVN